MCVLKTLQWTSFWLNAFWKSCSPSTTNICLGFSCPIGHLSFIQEAFVRDGLHVPSNNLFPIKLAPELGSDKQAT